MAQFEIDKIVNPQEKTDVISLTSAITLLNVELMNTQSAADKAKKTIDDIGKSSKNATEKAKEYDTALAGAEKRQTNLSQLQKERIKIQEQQKQTLAKLIVSEEKSNQVLLKGKIALQEKNKALKANAQQQRLVNDRLKSGQTDAKNITGAYKKLSDELNKQRTLAKDLGVVYGRNSEQFKKAATNVKSLDKEMKGLDSELGQSQRKVGQYGDAMGGLSPRFSGMINMAKQAGAALTTLFASPVGLVIAAVAALGAVIVMAVKQAQEYQAANAELAGVLGIVRAETKALQAESQRLGATTAFSANEVANLQIEYARLGFSQQSIIDVTESTINLSIAAKASAADTAAFVGGAIRQFGLTATEAARVADVAAKSYSSSGLSFDKLKEGFKNAAPAARAFGDSIEATTSKLAVLADNQIDASTSGSALRNIYIDLKAKGLTYDQAMTKINGSTDKLTTANELFGKRGAVVSLILAENAQKAKDLEVAYENAGGAAQKMADEQLNTVEGSLKLLSSSWSGLLFAFEDGEGVFIKIWKGMIDGATWFINTWTKEIKAISSNWKKLTNLFKSEGKIQAEAAVKAAKEKAKIEEELLEESKKRKLAEAQVDAELAVAKEKADKEALDAKKKHDKEMLASHLERVSSQAKLNKILLDIEKAQAKEFADFEKEQEKEILDEMKTDAEEQQALDTAQINASIANEERKYARKLMLIDASQMSEEEKAQAIFDLDASVLQSQLDNIGIILSATEEGTIERIDLEEQLAEKQFELDSLKIESDNAVAENDKKNDEEKRERIFKLAQDIAGIGQQAFDFATVLRERDLADIEAKEAAGVLTEEQAAKKVAAIKRKQFIADKAAALISIAINTAIAATKVTGQTGVGAVLAVPLVIAAGALQAAAVIAKPIPAFADGTHGLFNTPSDFIAGEAGLERVTTNTGDVYMPDKATRFTGYKFKGAKVESNKETEKYMATHTGMPSFSAPTKTDDRLYNEMKGMRKDIQNFPQPIYDSNMNKAGVKMGRSTKIYANEKFRNL